MKITHYLYNTFIIEEGDVKIAIDPGGLFLYYFRLTTLIPKSEWNSITHILVTHGDPDHYYHADRVAAASGAAVICNATMVREVNGRQLMLGPRSKGLTFNTPVDNIHTLSANESITLDGMTITGLTATHGKLSIKLGPFTKTVVPGPVERVGWGAIGFDINIAGKRVVNLGDTLLQLNDWKHIVRPDVLMLPIGGRTMHNTMDEDDALEVVRMTNPVMVIPCHYNCPGLFSREMNPADVEYFRTEAEKAGSQCVILQKGESLHVDRTGHAVPAAAHATPVD